LKLFVDSLHIHILLYFQVKIIKLTSFLDQVKSNQSLGKDA